MEREDTTGLKRFFDIRKLTPRKSWEYGYNAEILLAQVGLKYISDYMSDNNETVQNVHNYEFENQLQAAHVKDYDECLAIKYDQYNNDDNSEKTDSSLHLKMGGGEIDFIKVYNRGQCIADKIDPQLLLDKLISKYGVTGLKIPPADMQMVFPGKGCTICIIATSISGYKQKEKKEVPDFGGYILVKWNK